MLRNLFQRINNARKIIARGEFHPHYNRRTTLSSFVPEIYNKNGERMDVFFISDIHFAQGPHGLSQRFLWDRYNYGLKTHFYTHDKMLETVGKPDKKYGWLLESEAIVPKDYKIFDTNKGLNKDFDLIFTHSEKILRQCNEKDYEQRLPAIKDNYERVQKFLVVEDYLFDNYIAEGKQHG